MEISSLGGFGYFTAVAPIARAAATPESDDPETKMPGKSSGGSARRERQVLDVVVAAREGHSLSLKEALDDERVFDDPLVTFRMFGLVSERQQVIAESTGNHVQEDPPPVDVRE